jgi:Rieske Fe-S protein
LILDRRRFVEIALAASGLAALAPIANLGDFLTSPYKFVPVRLEIDGAAGMKDDSSLIFAWPTEVRPFDTNILIRDHEGKYSAYNRVCTHLGCLLNYNAKRGMLECPCHGSVFDATTGSVVAGPAPRALPMIVLQVDESGDVYAVNAVGTFGYGR